MKVNINYIKNYKKSKFDLSLFLGRTPTRLRAHRDVPYKVWSAQETDDMVKAFPNFDSCSYPKDFIERQKKKFSFKNRTYNEIRGKIRRLKKLQK